MLEEEKFIPPIDGNGTMPRGFAPPTSTRIFWRSRKRSASGKALTEGEDSVDNPVENTGDPRNDEKMLEATDTPPLSERRKALFEPLERIGNAKGRYPSSAESLLPPPDFDTTTYPRGWLIGKKRKLVNVDVVESMRRIAVQEINRKDREIDGLNEQLDEDARCLERLQVQLLDEKRKCTELERENAVLQDQITMLSQMFEDGEPVDEEEGAYDEEEAAAHAYDLASLKYWGPETILNFPPLTYEEELKGMEGQSKEEYVGTLRREFNADIITMEDGKLGLGEYLGTSTSTSALQSSADDCPSTSSTESDFTRQSFPDDIQTFFDCNHSCGFQEGDDGIFGDLSSFASPIFPCELDA